MEDFLSTTASGVDGCLKAIFQALFSRQTWRKA
jgi:hypothetical protein